MTIPTIYTHFIGSNQQLYIANTHPREPRNKNVIYFVPALIAILQPVWKQREGHKDKWILDVIFAGHAVINWASVDWLVVL